MHNSWLDRSPVTSIFNSSLREGVLPKLWKTATVIPLPKKRPPEFIENDIRPIALTPILAKVFESVVLKWVDNIISPQIDDKQFGGMAAAGTRNFFPINAPGMGRFQLLSLGVLGYGLELRFW